MSSFRGAQRERVEIAHRSRAADGWRRGRPRPSRSPTANRRRPGPAVERVVGALPVDLADRMDRRQVDHVEAHRRDRGESGRGGGERAVPGLAVLVPAAGGPREELVPRPEQGARAIDEHGVRLALRDELAQRMRAQQFGDVRPERRRHTCGAGDGRNAATAADPGQPRAVRARDALRGTLEQPRTDLEVVGQFRRRPARPPAWPRPRACHVVTGSLQASIRNVQTPSPVGVKEPSTVSGTGPPVIGMRNVAEPPDAALRGPRTASVAATAS